MRSRPCSTPRSSCREPKIRFGLDALIGLVPGIGDAITTAIALYIVNEARALGAPRLLVARMVANVALDGVVGAVPLVGDAFDVAFRANRRNMALLRDHLDKTEGRALRALAERTRLMGTPVTVSVPHKLGKEEAMRRLKGGLTRMRTNLSALVAIEQETWAGDTLQFSRAWPGADRRGLDHGVRRQSAHRGHAAVAAGEIRRTAAAGAAPRSDLAARKEIAAARATPGHARAVASCVVRAHMRLRIR